jgi:hypothetical protein
MAQDHRLHGFNCNVEEWFEGDHYETLAICRNLAIARAAFKQAIAAKPAGRFMIRSHMARKAPGGATPEASCLTGATPASQQRRSARRRKNWLPKQRGKFT